jgi:hypothetical protein
MPKAKAAEWAMNAGQWIRTALTDMRHAVGQAERGRQRELADEYDRVCRRLERLNAYLEEKYGVPPPTGVGKRED